MLYQVLFGRERTTSVTVHERPDHAGDRISRAEALKFVKDGFDWGAFIIPPAFFLQHQLWLGLFAYLLGVAAVAVLFLVFALPTSAIVILIASIHAFIAWEADEMRRAQLEARGWSMIGQVSGSSLLDCERRFLDGWIQSVPIKSGLTGRGSVPKVSDLGAVNETMGRETGASSMKRILGSMIAPRARH